MSNSEIEGFYFDEGISKFTNCAEGCKKCTSRDSCLKCDSQANFFTLTEKEEKEKITTNKMRCVKECPNLYLKNNDKKMCNIIKLLKYLIKYR